MNIVQKAKEFIMSNEVHEFCIDIVSDSIAFMEGDVIAGARILNTIKKGALQIRDQMFWGKFERFLNELDVSGGYLGKFCKVMAEHNNGYEYSARVIDTIDKIDTLKKAKYLANASRCVAVGFIDKTTYFRICHTLKGCLQEDLLFLQNNILSDDSYAYSDTIQGLMNNGLMYQSVIDSNGNDRYSFTPFADVMDRFAISYDNEERYPNPLSIDTKSIVLHEHSIKTVARLG